MKYIKAKIVNGETKIYSSDIDKGFLSCVCAEIISEADTIEELCDYVAVWYRENDTPLFIHKSMLRDDRPSLQEQKVNKEIYDFKLCVLTSTGLIYVAKMNADGKLVLM